jgi:hypothetical protein
LPGDVHFARVLQRAPVKLYKKLCPPKTSTNVSLRFHKNARYGTKHGASAAGEMPVMIFGWQADNAVRRYPCAFCFV